MFDVSPSALPIHVPTLTTCLPRRSATKAGHPAAWWPRHLRDPPGATPGLPDHGRGLTLPPPDTVKHRQRMSAGHVKVEHWPTWRKGKFASKRGMNRHAPLTASSAIPSVKSGACPAKTFVENPPAMTGRLFQRDVVGQIREGRRHSPGHHEHLRRPGGARTHLFAGERQPCAPCWKVSRLGVEERRLWNDNRHRYATSRSPVPPGTWCSGVLHENGTANIGVKMHGKAESRS